MLTHSEVRWISQYEAAESKNQKALMAFRNVQLPAVRSLDSWMADNSGDGKFVAAVAGDSNLLDSATLAAGFTESFQSGRKLWL
jgi:hypothetical protein